MEREISEYSRAHHCCLTPVRRPRRAGSPRAAGWLVGPACHLRTSHLLIRSPLLKSGHRPTKARNDFLRNAQRSEARCRERDIHRSLRRRLLCNSRSYWSRAKPRFSRIRVLHVDERIRRTRHLTVSKPDETLHVGVIDLAHSSATHSRAWSSVIDDISNPLRIRVFLSKSTALSPG